MLYSQFLAELVKRYNYEPQVIEKDSLTVTSEQLGNYIYFKGANNGSFWASRETELVFWLVPTSSFSIDEFNLITLEKFFECRNYSDRNNKKFALIRPAKLELIPETGKLLYQEKGILDFGEISKKKLTDLEYWVSETEDILIQSLAEKIAAQFNDSVNREIATIKENLANLEEQQKTHISSPSYFDNWIKIDKVIKDFKSNLQIAFDRLKTLSNKLDSTIEELPIKIKELYNSVNSLYSSGSSGFMGISTANSNQNPLGATVTALPCRQ